MATKKITLSDVAKKDLRVLLYLLVNGGIAFLSQKLEVKPELALIFGAAANYVVFRINEELTKEGYLKALKA